MFVALVLDAVVSCPPVRIGFAAPVAPRSQSDAIPGNANLYGVGEWKIFLQNVATKTLAAQFAPQGNQAEQSATE
jgi:hypothetical protein